MVVIQNPIAELSLQKLASAVARTIIDHRDLTRLEGLRQHAPYRPRDMWFVIVGVDDYCNRVM